MQGAGVLDVFDHTGENTTVELYLAELDERLPLTTPPGARTPDLVDPRWILADEIPYADMPYDYRLWLPLVLDKRRVQLRLHTDSAGRVAEGVGDHWPMVGDGRAVPIRVQPEPGAQAA